MKGLNAKALGLAGGVLWGAAAFILALLAQQGYAVEIVNLIGTGYIGYDASVAGAVIGAIWGFIDAFIGLYIFAWLYNKFAK